MVNGLRFTPQQRTDKNNTSIFWFVSRVFQLEKCVATIFVWWLLNLDTLETNHLLPCSIIITKYAIVVTSKLLRNIYNTILFLCHHRKWFDSPSQCIHIATLALFWPSLNLRTGSQHWIDLICHRIPIDAVHTIATTFKYITHPINMATGKKLWCLHNNLYQYSNGAYVIFKLQTSMINSPAEHTIFQEWKIIDSQNVDIICQGDEEVLGQCQ